MAEFERQARLCLQKKFALKSTKTIATAELYLKAGHMHKSANAWPAAGSAYVTAGDLFLSVNDEPDGRQLAAHSAYEDGCRALLRSSNPADHERARALYDDVLIPAWVVGGGSTAFDRIGRAHESLALNMEENGALRAALDRWKLAEDAYVTHDATSMNVRKCLVHAAWLRAIAFLEHREAAEGLEKAAQICLAHDLLRFNAAPFFLDALFCTLASGDVVSAERNLERYEDMDPMFKGSTSDRLASELIRAVADRDTAAFVEALAKFDSARRLDNNQVVVLQRTRQAMETLDLS